MSRLQDRVAIVTGGASGIGLACAHRLAAEGARVVIADLVADRASAAAQTIDGAIGLGCDVSDEAQVQACVQATVEHAGRLDIIINNAGMMIFKPLVETTSADWLKVLGVDLMGAVHFIKAGLPHMGPGGAVVNIASVHAVETTPLVATYAAAKAALLSLTRSAAIEAVPVRVNAILPGAVDTPMLWENPNVKSGVEIIDRKAVGRPDDLAAAVAFLASDDAAFITGASLNVDGGRLARL